VLGFKLSGVVLLAGTHGRNVRLFLNQNNCRFTGAVGATGSNTLGGLNRSLWSQSLLWNPMEFFTVCHLEANLRTTVTGMPVGCFGCCDDLMSSVYLHVD